MMQITERPSIIYQLCWLRRSILRETETAEPRHHPPNSTPLRANNNNDNNNKGRPPVLGESRVQPIEPEATKQALGEFFPDCLRTHSFGLPRGPLHSSLPLQVTTLYLECCQSCGFSKQHDLHWLEQCDIPHRMLSFCFLPAFSRGIQRVAGPARYRWLVSLAIRLNCSSRLTYFNEERAPVPASHMRV